MVYQKCVTLKVMKNARIEIFVFDTIKVGIMHKKEIFKFDSSKVKVVNMQKDEIFKICLKS